MRPQPSIHNRNSSELSVSSLRLRSAFCSFVRGASIPQCISDLTAFLPSRKRTLPEGGFWPTCVPEACYLVGQRAGGTPPTAKCSIPACRRRRPNSGARPKAEDRVTLPPRNVSLAEWLNSGKENGSDEVNEGAVHAGVQARGGADGQGRPEPGSRVEGARDQQTSADSLKS